jgi:hypothetical protein
MGNLAGFVCYSGGAIGSDQFWESIGRKYGIHTIVYQLHRDSSPYYETRIPTPADFEEARPHVMAARDALHRHFPTRSEYADHLILRDWCQIRNSDGVFAIGRITPDQAHVEGGTGWGVEMAIARAIPVWVFDYRRAAVGWYQYNYSDHIFRATGGIPILVSPFAGIGTRGEAWTPAETLPSDWISVSQDSRYPLNAMRAIKAVYDATDQFVNDDLNPQYL